MKLILLANLKGLVVKQNNMRKIRQGFIKTKGVAGWTLVPLVELENYRKNIEPNTSPRDIVEIGDWSGAKDQIQQTKIDYFKPDEPETDHSQKDEEMRKLNTNYANYRKSINSMTPEKKAERIELFNLFYWGMTKKHEVPEDIKNKVIEIQTKFFRENPKRIYCSPILFKELFESNQVFNPVLAMVERVVAEDMKNSRY